MAARGMDRGASNSMPHAVTAGRGVVKAYCVAFRVEVTSCT